MDFTDLDFMAAALALSARGRALSTPNPNVGCIIMQGGRVVGRGWTQAGGRPHAEAMALELAGAAARGATAYVTLEPCAHISARGPMCAQALIEAGVARLVIASCDPDPRTDGAGIGMLRSAGIEVVEGVLEGHARDAMAGYFSRRQRNRPYITAKLATSIDGCIALASGESRWITGPAARAHAHLERALSNMILVGGATLRIDDPKLDVRLPGLDSRSPRRAVLTRGDVPPGWQAVRAPTDVATLVGVDWLLIEGGAQTIAAFLAADLVDRLLVYRAPIVIGGGKASLADVGLSRLADAHGRWRRGAVLPLGDDLLEDYRRDR